MSHDVNVEQVSASPGSIWIHAWFTRHAAESASRCVWVGSSWPKLPPFALDVGDTRITRAFFVPVQTCWVRFDQ